MPRANPPDPGGRAPIASRKRRQPFNYLKGREFGLLTVEEETSRRVSGQIVWKCRCRCGAAAEVCTANLTSGNTISCGCEQVRRSRRRGVRHDGPPSQ